MASHVVVVGSTARTVKVQTTPGKYLTEVRDEACNKFNLKAEQYTLKYNNKPISLSQQIRLANLPQGARLELVQSSRSPSVVSIALQLPASERSTRLTQKFASNTSLWEILRQFESGSGANYNFTQRGVPEMDSNGASGAGRLNYEMPVITIMPSHQELSTFVGLQKTLGQLGLDGNALLRLGFRNSGKPLEEAMAEISQYFKSSDPTPSGAHAETSEQAVTAPDPGKAVPGASEIVASEAVSDEQPQPEPGSESQPMDVDTEPAQSDQFEAAPTVDAANFSHDAALELAQGPITTRNFTIYSAPANSTPKAAQTAFNENDYVPTIEHAKAHQAALQSKTRNQRLLSDKELEQQESERLEKMKAAAEKGGSLRIRMPDQSMIQTRVTKSDTAESLYEFVDGMLAYKGQPFLLRYPGRDVRFATMTRDKKKLIEDLGVSGNTLVTFVWDDNASNEARLSKPTLAKEYQDKAQTLKVEEPPAPEDDTSGPSVQSKAEGKKKSNMSSADKENKLKSFLNKGLFKNK